MLPAAKPVYRERDLLLRQRTAVPLFGDDIIHAHKKISFIRFGVRAGQPTRTLLQPERKGADGRPRRQPAPDSFSFRAAF